MMQNYRGGRDDMLDLHQFRPHKIQDCCSSRMWTIFSSTTSSGRSLPPFLPNASSHVPDGDLKPGVNVSSFNNLLTRRRCGKAAHYGCSGAELIVCFGSCVMKATGQSTSDMVHRQECNTHVSLDSTDLHHHTPLRAADLPKTCGSRDESDHAVQWGA